MPRGFGPVSVILLAKTFAPLKVLLYFQVTSAVFETGKDDTAAVLCADDSPVQTAQVWNG